MQYKHSTIKRFEILLFITIVAGISLFVYGCSKNARGLVEKDQLVEQMSKDKDVIAFYLVLYQQMDEIGMINQLVRFKPYLRDSIAFAKHRNDYQQQQLKSLQEAPRTIFLTEASVKMAQHYRLDRLSEMERSTLLDKVFTIIRTDKHHAMNSKKKVTQASNARVDPEPNDYPLPTDCTNWYLITYTDGVETESDYMYSSCADNVTGVESGGSVGGGDLSPDPTDIHDCALIRNHSVAICDETMLTKVGALYTAYGLTVLFSGGTAAVPAFAGLLAAIAWLAVEHSNCVDNATWNYNLCMGYPPPNE